MEKLNLVIGGNGHLGNNLVRALLEKGETVRTSVRNLNNYEPFEGLDCEIVQADMLDKASLLKAMKQVDFVYITAAVYKTWAKDIKKEIIDVNIQGIKNIMEAADEQEIKKVIYVGSTLTLDPTKLSNGKLEWNQNISDPYIYSKIEAEKLMWKLAEKYNLDVVSIIPSAMIGTHCHGHITPSMEFLKKVINSKLPFDPGFYFNYVAIQDVAKAMIRATETGMTGERYILAQESPICSTEVFKLAKSIDSNVKVPKKASYKKLLIIATIMEFISKIARKKPIMTRNQVKQFTKPDYKFNISKARNDLGANPTDQREILLETLSYLKG